MEISKVREAIKDHSRKIFDEANESENKSWKDLCIQRSVFLLDVANALQSLEQPPGGEND